MQQVNDGPCRYQPCSPDVTTLDFLSLAYVESKVFEETISANEKIKCVVHITYNNHWQIFHWSLCFCALAPIILISAVLIFYYIE